MKGVISGKSYGQSPYQDEDFVYEGYKEEKYCELYVDGTGCPDAWTATDGSGMKHSKRTKEDAMYVDSKEQRKNHHI